MSGRPNQHYPLLIGFGAASETLVEQIAGSLSVPFDAGLYRTCDPKTWKHPAWLSIRELLCEKFVLLIDAADEEAQEGALAWAEQRRKRRANFGATVLINATGASADLSWKRQLRSALEAVIEVRSCGRPLGVPQAVQYLVEGLLFPAKSLIAYTYGELAWQFAAGPEARANAVGWGDGRPLQLAMAEAAEELGPQICQGAIVWVHAGLDLTLREVRAVHEHYARLLPTTADRFVALVEHPDWANGQRVLAQVLVGDWNLVSSSLAPTWRMLDN